MNKKLLSVAAIAGVLGLLNLMSHAEQRGQAPFKALVSPATCAQPQWPDEARRYEIEGVTTIRFRIGEDGKVVHPEVSKSSGWKILDDAAINGISRCVFQPRLDEARDGTSFPMQYVWQFSDGPVIRPLLVAGSCQPSERFQTFRDADRRPSGSDGILLRFLVNSDGAPIRVVAEPNGQAPDVVEQAAAYLQGCRFAIDPRLPGQHTDTAFGRVLLKL
ncbi:energy transducer TonB [Duganella sp. HH105]|uniref:energy transducer TonB n=1 Tax=Duganella sp. HH105 TaxID=1781067 RepID=UPI000877B4E5|nr:energy transducer TonB [Duganella sp. HH105]OEZ55490.1 gram-negative bacterial tonB protein [Duganella sp. HH105]